MTTDRRTLGSGPADSTGTSTPVDGAHVRVLAHQADTGRHPLHDVRLPDLDELRLRGVLGAPAPRT